MRIFRINNNTTFTSIRQDRNSVEQLKHDNAYDLNYPNQRRISTAIEELGKVPGEDNVKFLLDVSENLRYGTNINIVGKKPYNDWRDKLNKAARQSFELSDKSIQEKLSQELNKVINSSKELSADEKEILANREILLSKIDSKKLKDIKNKNTANLKKNLSYFVISSEVPISQKKYILKRLNYFMSDDYKINPQLRDKKTQILAEIINDIVVDTPESKIPNIKAINQKQHGMCAAISICRKALAYEDKANYVDMILSELDESEFIQAYDRTNLGKHKKVPIPKAKIDYLYAIKKGYRIVDTSAMNWMNAVDTVGAFNNIVGRYHAFDKENFGTFNDTHVHKDIDESSHKYQNYYRSCQKAKNAIRDYKKIIEKEKYYAQINKQENKEKFSLTQANQKLIYSILKQIAPSTSESKRKQIASNIQLLLIDNSDQAKKLDSALRQFSFVNNEEDNVKAQKIADYLNSVLPENNNKIWLNEKSKELVELIHEIRLANRNHSKTKAEQYSQNHKLYQAAAAYRTMQSFALNINEYLSDMMVQFNIPDNETYLIQNLHKLSNDIRSGKINPELKEKLYENFENEIAKKFKYHNKDRDIALAQILEYYAQNVSTVITTFADHLFNSILLENRNKFLVAQISAVKDEIEKNKDKSVIERLASSYNLKPDRQHIINQLNNYIDTLESENCTNAQFIEIFNKTGHKSHLLDMKESLENVAQLLFTSPNEAYIKGFNLVNGLPKDASSEEIYGKYKQLADSFNNLSIIIYTLQKALRITGNDGTILNSANPKYGVMKKLENMGEIPTEKELISFREKFDTYYKMRSSENGEKVRFKDLPGQITGFTQMEKDALNKYRRNINSWYSTSTRRLNDIYTEMKEPLEELNREIGVEKGENWTTENDSGLLSNQSLKIFEHMTDRPYYEERNIKSGIRKIKNSPYSGTSQTSVKDNEPAMHAQYVVDIKPTILRNGNDENIKNIIFHDNTWGGIEHENTWVDSQGFLRTDYNADYGGEKGYITNKQYLNGIIEDNIIDKKGEYIPSIIPSKKYKKLVNDNNEPYTFPMIRSLILYGVSPEAMSTVKEIKQTLLLPSYEYLDDLTDYASKMTTEELDAKIKKIETAGKESKQVYNLLLKRINGDKIFDKGIDSEEKYYSLSPNDKLRLIAEKVAIIKSYDDIPDINTYNIEVNSQKELDKLRKKLRIEARNNFDYIMGKNPDILKYATESIRKEIYELLKQFANDNNINLSYKSMTQIVNSMKRVKNNSYNGNVSQGIDLMLNNFEKFLKLKTNIDDAAAKNFSEKLRPIIENELTITENDVKKSFTTGRNVQIADWIDREFSPKTDKEFAQIINNIRNMKNKDFIKLYNSKISDNDLGIKSINGYDIVKMIRSGNDNIKNSFINTVFSEHYYRDIDESKTRAYYDLNKLSRNLSSGTYVGGIRSFDDLYSDFYYSLQNLTVKKEFDKYKDEAFRKYFAFPAYPLIEISTPEMLNESLNTLYKKLSEHIELMEAYNNQYESLNIIEKLKKYSDKHFNDDNDITEKQYSMLFHQINKLGIMNSNDETMEENRNEIKKLFQSGTRKASAFKGYIESTYNLIKMYEYTADGKTMAQAKAIKQKRIKEYLRTYVMVTFGPKYQNKAFELLNKWLTAKYKENKKNNDINKIITYNDLEIKNILDEQNNYENENADYIFEEYEDLFMKHRLLTSPEQYVREYLRLCTKDSKQPDGKTSKETKDNNGIEDIKNIYKNNLKSLLYKADMMKLKYILMECAQKGNLNAVRNAFKNSTIEMTNGTVMPLDSEEGLNIIISPMLSEENLDTAVLFLNQLGLSENVANMIVDNNSLDIAYKNFNRIQSILKSVDTQVEFAKNEFLKLKNLDNNPDYEKVILDYKEKLVDKCNKTNFRSGKDIFIAAIEDALEEIKMQPNQSKYLILGADLNMAANGLREVVKNHIDDLNIPLQAMQKNYDLIQKLHLPDDTKIKSKIEKYLEDIQKLLEYQQNRIIDFPNIGVTSE